ncbi:tetratricopeptide repeat protein [bacterium]|jgi:tetratricopeptide (TPR) repeat protein|nr:tetratricopeptide repeat protein [bacterium]
MTRAGDCATGAHQGYLLFEQDDGSKHLVPAALLGDMLNQQRVPLVILSACQSAKLGGDDPLGSVAARLTRAGIPNVLAMTHSVLVETTRALFGHLYRELGRGRPLGTALENARRELYARPVRGERRRGTGWTDLILHDWFLPTLYRTGDDAALLAQPAAPADARPDPAAVPAADNLPQVQPAGFWGRARELWDIERAYVGGTRRLVVCGFGGQGKTTLAQEAGRWLRATGLFERVCLVGYADFQGIDPVGWAVSSLAQVLGEALLDERAAAAALARVPTLLILDNLESLIEPAPGQSATERPDRTRLDALLAAAQGWSESGASRCLVTTRTPDLAHPAFPTDGDRRCRYLTLKGLAPWDALAWYQSILRQSSIPPAEPPPGRDALTALFERVDFHPLSIGLLAESLKRDPIRRVAERLEALLAAGDGPLVASLNLSLERLDADSSALLPRLGVFRGGTFEDDLLAVTEIAPDPWSVLRSALISTGLIQVEPVAGVDPHYVRFHPTLAPTLWARLEPDAQARLGERFRDYHARLARDLYQQDDKNPHAIRAIARLILPNLMAAASQSLDCGAPGAVEFVLCLKRFLDYFGLTGDSAELTARAGSLAGESGSDNWYLARVGQGEALLQAGRLADAALVFEEVLAGLPESPNYQRCTTLHLLGRCRKRQRRAAEAESALRQAIAEAGTLEPGDQVKRELGTLHGELADVLSDRGDYAQARAAYESALAIFREVDDLRGAAVDEGQLGTLAYRQGDLAEAERRYREALSAFQRLGEPQSEAVAWHQLGMVYADAEHWEPAERAYRASAELNEASGNRTGAARTWDQLAQMFKARGRPQEAEGWSGKALAVERESAEPGELSATLNNLADLLRGLPDRLDEARTLAEESLAIKRTLDPAAAEIWTTYSILAAIAESQGDRQSAARYRREERAAYAGFAGSSHALRRQGALIAAVVESVARPQHRAGLEQALESGIERGLANRVAAIRRILDGERDADALCEPLDREDALIVQTILEGLRDPDAIRDLTDPPDADEQG